MSESGKLMPLQDGYQTLKSFRVAPDGKAEGRRLKAEVKIENHLCP